MGNIEERVQQLFASVEELRVLAEMDKIRYEESSKFLSLLQQSLGEDNKLPYPSPTVAIESVNVVIDYWKSQINVITRVLPNLEKELEDAVVQTEKLWENVLKIYKKGYDEYTHGNKKKGEKMLTETLTEVGDLVIAVAQVSSGVYLAYTCITDLLDRLVDD